MPFAVENKSPFPHFAFLKTGPRGTGFGVLVVRATFDWMHNGEMNVSAEQSPVIMADQPDGAPDDGALRLETDLVIGKPRADILVVGHAHALRRAPLSGWPVRVQIGEFFKELRVTGPRWWERDVLGFRLTPAQPVDRVRLSYRLAFGGTRRSVNRNAEPDEERFEANPVGVGFKGRFPVREARWLAPQTEAMDAPIRSISECPAPEGLGPIARAWQPRRARAGSLTQAFVRYHPGKMPEDFEWSFYNSAPPGLIYPGFLLGDEQVSTLGLFPEGSSSSRMPGYRAMAVLELASGVTVAVTPKLDTWTLDTDARRVYATFRVTAPIKLGIRTVVFGFSVPRPTHSGDRLVGLRLKD
jgi:hypothetical protein